MIRGPLVALLVALALPATAGAHARLVATAPERGAVVASQPAAVELRFNEPVESGFGAIRVFDAGGERVDDGRVARPGGASSALGVGLRPGLADGTYTATYRIVSADGHPVSGGLVFSLGAAGAGPARSVDELLGAAESGPVTNYALWAAKAVQYGATAVLIGGLVFLRWCWRAASAPFARRTRRVLLAACAAGVGAGAGMLVLQGAVAGGTDAWTAVDADVLRDVVETRLGGIWALRTLVWALLGGLVAAAGTRRLPWLVAPALFLLVAPALSGHPASQSPRGLLTALDVVHVGAMSTWLGGLVFLLLAVPAATRGLAPAARTPLLAGVLSRFSPLALGAVIVLVASGVVQSIVHLQGFGELLDTAFGRAILVKGGIVLALVGLGAVNRRRVLPRLRAAAAGDEPPGGAGRLLRTTLRGEVALLAVVLVATGALTSSSPPAALAGGIFSAQEELGPLTLDLTLDPAQTGPNELHLYLFDRSDGAQFEGTKEISVRLSLPSQGIGPIEAELRPAGPGHYVADALPLAPAGEWELDVSVRVSEFDQHDARLEVDVE